MTYDNNDRLLIILRIVSLIYFPFFDMELFKCGTMAICIWMLSIFDKKYLFVVIIFLNIELHMLPAKMFQKAEPKHCLTTWNQSLISDKPPFETNSSSMCRRWLFIPFQFILNHWLYQWLAYSNLRNLMKFEKNPANLVFLLWPMRKMRISKQDSADLQC